MGIVWEAYHKGVPLLGVPGNPIEFGVGSRDCQSMGTIQYDSPRMPTNKMDVVANNK